MTNVIITAITLALTMCQPVSATTNISIAENIKPVTEAVEVSADDIAIETQEEIETPACELADNGQVYVGEYRITYYCPGSCCNGGWSGTASGAPLSPGYTVAASDFGFGTTLLIDGVGYRCVQDTGVGSGCIDVCVGSHEEALALGMHYSSVYVIQ